MTISYCSEAILTFGALSLRVIPYHTTYPEIYGFTSANPRVQVLCPYIIHPYDSPLFSYMDTKHKESVHRTPYCHLFQGKASLPNGDDDGVPNGHTNRLQPNPPRQSLRQPEQLLRNDNRERLHPNRVRGANRPSGIRGAVDHRGRNLAAPEFSADPAA